MKPIGIHPASLGFCWLYIWLL